MDYKLMLPQHQQPCETILDICIYMGSISNMTPHFTKPLTFMMSCFINHTYLSFPYQIISSHHPLPNSSIDTNHYTSKQYILSPNQHATINEICICRMHIPIHQLDLAHLVVKFEMIADGNIIGTFQRPFNQILNLHTYIPVYFLPLSIGIDATIQTQLLTFRLPTNCLHPRSTLYKIIDFIVVEYNRIRQKWAETLKYVGKEYILDEHEDIIGQFPQYQNLKQQQLLHIFNKKTYQEEHKDLLNFVEHFLPRITSQIKIKWNGYIENLMERQKMSIDHQKERYFEEYSFTIQQKMVKSALLKELYVCANVVDLNGISISLMGGESRNSDEQNRYLHHLVVLVHGHGAHSTAMLYFEKYLTYLYPHLLILNSKSNQNSEQQESIGQKGRKLAAEIELYLQEKQLSSGDNVEISFIGHSLGGLIIRAALQSLQLYKYCMSTYISLSTPHLGHLYHNSKLTKVGMWAMSTITESTVMNSLLLKDGSDERASFLYNLCSHPGLSWFKTIIMYGSENDGYVSCESAIVHENMNEGETEKSRIWSEMFKNVQKNCQGRCEQYQVKFNNKHNQIEQKLLGRSSHLAFANDPSFIECVLLMNRRSFAPLPDQ